LLLLEPPLLFTITVPLVSSSIVPALKLPEVTEGGEDKDFQLPAITFSSKTLFTDLRLRSLTAASYQSRSVRSKANHAGNCSLRERGLICSNPVHNVRTKKLG
jgi:hypothetical protein